MVTTIKEPSMHKRDPFLPEAKVKIVNAYIISCWVIWNCLLANMCSVIDTLGLLQIFGIPLILDLY